MPSTYCLLGNIHVKSTSRFETPRTPNIKMKTVIIASLVAGAAAFAPAANKVCAREKLWMVSAVSEACISFDLE